MKVQMRQNDLTSPPLASVLRAVAIASFLTFSGFTVSGCSETITKHGQLFRQTDLQAVQPGMSKEQVRSTLGTPATTAVIGDGHAFYYISSTEAQSSFFLPKETDRQVVAVYFNQGGTVDSIANYGLKDGKVFDFISRQTPAPGSKDEGILKSLFRNLGKKQLFGDG